VPVVAIRRLLSAEGAGADSIGRRKFCMLKCRIDTACREPASAHPIPPRRSTCFRERDLHNSKEIIFRAARLAGSSRSRSEKFDDLCENSRASFPEHQTALRGGATYSPGESRRRVLVKRSALGWGEWGGGKNGIRSQGLALFGNAPRRAASVCAVLCVHYVTARRRSLTVSPDNSRLSMIDATAESWVGIIRRLLSISPPLCGRSRFALGIERNECECACFADSRSLSRISATKPTGFRSVCCEAHRTRSLARSMILEFSPATGKE